jgi:hypothetical protein
MSKDRYRLGDEFKGTLKIVNIEGSDDNVYHLKVVELGIRLEEWVEFQDLEEAFNPVVRKKLLMDRSVWLKKELSEVEQELRIN